VSLFMTIVFRGVITFLMLLLFFRSMGPRQLTQFTFKDYVLGVLVGSMGGRAITRPEQAYITFLYGIVTVIIMQMLLSYLCLKSDRIRRFINGQPIIVISKGEILKNNLKKARLTMNELASLLRSESIFNLSEVEYAILEPTRCFSVMQKSERSPVTLSDLNIQTAPRELPILVIKDGKLIRTELYRYNLTEKWVKEQLLKRDIKDISEVLLAQADSSGIVYTCLNNTNK